VVRVRKRKIYEEGLAEYPKAAILLGNLMMLIWIALGTIGCWLLHPLIAWVYLAFAVIMVGIVLRKLLCTSCYYYGKWCPIGWGKLSALMFKKADESEFGTGLGFKLAPVTYGLLTLIPIVTIVVSFFIRSQFWVQGVIILTLLLLVSAYSGTISRKKSCAKCKVRFMCPGSAAK